MAAILLLALCGGGGGGVFSRAMAHILNACIETYTVWWWRRSFHLEMHVVDVIL